MTPTIRPTTGGLKTCAREATEVLAGAADAPTRNRTWNLLIKSPFPSAPEPLLRGIFAPRRDPVRRCSPTIRPTTVFLLLALPLTLTGCSNLVGVGPRQQRVAADCGGVHLVTRPDSAAGDGQRWYPQVDLTICADAGR